MVLRQLAVTKTNKVCRLQKYAVFSWNFHYPGSVRWMTEQGKRDLFKRTAGYCRIVTMYSGQSMRDVYLGCFKEEVRFDLSWWLTCHGF
jgi:hypothetical protein